MSAQATVRCARVTIVSAQAGPEAKTKALLIQDKVSNAAAPMVSPLCAVRKS